MKLCGLASSHRPLARASTAPTCPVRRDWIAPGTTLGEQLCRLEYQFELRRWPREFDRGIDEGSTDDGRGALPINQASLFINDYHHLSIGEKLPYGFEGLTKPVRQGDRSVKFSLSLKKRPMALHTWFRGQDIILSAYYVYVTRK